MGTNVPGSDRRELPELTGSVRLVRIPDRRTVPDRRMGARGGRRVTDRLGRSRPVIGRTPHLADVLSVRRWFSPLARLGLFRARSQH